jgi:hypothetical protein
LVLESVLVLVSVLELELELVFWCCLSKRLKRWIFKRSA